MLHWKRKLYADGGVLRDSGGGGGGGAPTQSTTYQTNIPEYAKPYVANMLGATQQQLFNTQTVGATPDRVRQIGVDENNQPIMETIKGEEGRTEITGFKPYRPYSQNVSDYVAGFSPMQQQAFSGMAGMRPAAQLGTATDLAGIAGLGSLGAGAQFARQATDPYAMQAYMSPYMQNVVDYQKQAAVRDYAMAMPKLQAQAVGQGAFGGNRMALQQAEAQRGLMSQLQGIQAQGAQKAFEDAQRQMQFGSQLGLQGYGQALQGAGQLGQLGQTQYGQQMGILEGLSKFGGQQQALEQQKINQAIQDYATAQQYPLMQLGFMSNMLRGLPMQATTTQSYQATPSTLTQGLGALAGFAGAKQAGLFAEGGTIKGLAAGGVTGYANRGMVQANPDSGVVRGIRAKLEMMPSEQLQRVAQTSPSEEIRAMALQILREQQIREQAEAQAQQSIAQDQRGLPTPVSERVGLPAAPAGAMDTLNAASGGIVAFAGPTDGSQVELDDEEANRLQQEFLARQQYADFYRKQREAAGVGAPKAGLADVLAQEKTDLAEARKRAQGYNLIDLATRVGTQTGPLPYALLKGTQGALPSMIQREQDLVGREREINKGLAEVKEGERLMKLGDITAGNAMFEKGQDRISKERIGGMKSPGNMMQYANNYLAERVAAGDTRDKSTIVREGMDAYMYLYGAAGPRAATAATTATTNLYDKARDNVDNSLAKNFNSPENKELRRLQKDDKKNKTNTANTYLQELYRNEEKRLQGGQRAQSAPPSGGGGNKPKASAADFDKG